MAEYNLRRLRFHLFTLYNIQREAVRTCRNLESVTNLPAFPLYDLVKYNQCNISDDLESNFIALVLKCIIVHVDRTRDHTRYLCAILRPFQARSLQPQCQVRGAKNHTSECKEWGECVAKNGDSSCSVSRAVDTHSYVNNPAQFFISDLGARLKAICGYHKFESIYRNHRVLVPVYIFQLAESPLYSAVRSLDELDPRYEPLLKFSRTLLARTLRLLDNDVVKSVSKAYVQCSGHILYNEFVNVCSVKGGGKESKENWSQMVVYRNFIFLRGLTENKRVVYKTLVETVPSDECVLWKLFTYIIFNDQMFDKGLKPRRESLNALFEEWESGGGGKAKGHKRKSLLQGLFIEFKRFFAKARAFDWQKKLYLESRRLQGASFRTVPVPAVYKYVKHIVQRTIDPALLCGSSNYQAFLRICYTMITLNKGENLSMAEVMRGISVRGCTWAKMTYHTRGQTRTILRYLCRTIFFLVQYYILPAMGKHLHVTECGFSNYRIHYIRNEQWVRMVRQAREEYLSNGTLRDKTSESEELPKLKFVPKNRGMRPILNCNTLAGCRNFYRSLLKKTNHTYTLDCKCYSCNVYSDLTNFRNLNYLLKKIHEALSENSRLKPILGNGVLGYTAFYNHLKNWWTRFIRSLGPVSDVKLYYFVGDLSRFYERISHEKLIQVLSEIPLVDCNLTLVYKRSFLSLASSVNSYAKIVSVSGSSSRKRTNAQLRSYGNSIISPRNVHRHACRVTKFDIVAAVSALISSQNLALPCFDSNKYIKLERGIPQGCCISPFISTLYLSTLDRILACHSKSSLFLDYRTVSVPNLLVRWIDDFLFVSTNPEDVKSVSMILNSSSLEASINFNKVHTNTVNHGCSHRVQSTSKSLEWINSRMNFDVKNGFINVELLPWKCRHLRVRDTVSLARRRGTLMFSMIEQRLLGYIMNKLHHRLYTCSSINSPPYILLNAYVVMRICSMKLRSNLRVLVENFGGFINLRYLWRLILALVGVAVGLVSKGGLDVKGHNLTEFLLLPFIHTFKSPEGSTMGLRRPKSRSARAKERYFRAANVNLIRKLHDRISSCPCRQELLSTALRIEDRHRKIWSHVL